MLLKNTDTQTELSIKFSRFIPGIASKPCIEIGMHDVKPPGKKLKILHLEDLPSDALLIRTALEKANFFYEVLVVDTKDKFVKALSEFSPDIILADHSLPSFNSTEALAIFQETRMKIPFILITAAMPDEFAADIIKKGANDYILKDRLSRLPFAIHNALEKICHEKERQTFLEELVKNEKRYRSLVENGADAVVILNVDGKPDYVSSSMQQVLGYTEAEGMQLNVFEIIHPEDQKEVIKKMAECLDSPGITIKGCSARIKHKDQSWRWVEATLTNLLHDPAINGIVNNFRDVTERKLAEGKIIHLNHLYAFVSQVNQVIAQVNDQQLLFNEVCQIAAHNGSMEIAVISLVDEAAKTLNLIAQTTVAKKGVEFFNALSYDDEGATAEIIKNNTLYVINDFEKEPHQSIVKQYALSNGIRSAIHLPLKKSGKVSYVLTLFASSADFFNQEETNLLQVISNDISFALDSFEKAALKLRADERLRHNELRLNQAQSIAHVGSWELNFSTGVLTWSEEALRIHGLDIRERHQSYESWLSFIHPDDLGYVLRTTKAAELTRSNTSFAYRIIRKDGTERNLFSRAHFELDTNGAPAGIYGIVHDITEIKRAEQAVKKSELFSKGILASLSSHIAVIDKSGILISVNKAWDDFAKENGPVSLRRTSKGSNYFDVCKKAMAEGDAIAKQVMEGIQSVFKKDKPFFEIEYPCHSPVEQRWFVLRVMNFGNDDSKVVTSHQDITEIKNAEEALRKSENRYRQIVETAQEGIWLIDENDTTTFVNNKMCEIFEYAEEEMVGRKIYHSMDEGGKQKALQLIKEIRNRKSGNHECLFISKTGKEVWTNLSANPVFDKEGKYRGALAMVSDITEQKSLRKKLLDEQLNSQKEITKAVINAQEKERAEIGAELHDNVNQLLAASKLYLSYSLTQLGDTSSIVKGEKYVTTAMEEIRKLSHALVGPGQEIDMGLCNSLEELIFNITNVKQLSIKLICNSYKEDEVEVGLKLVIYRIVQEQLSNIIKYADASEVEIELQREAGDLIVNIKDNGKGFDTSVKRNGIGLKNIKNRAHIYNGLVQVLSSPNNGCQIKIVFKSQW